MRKRRTREINDCDQQPLSQLDYKDLFCFYNRERIFWRFCVKPGSHRIAPEDENNAVEHDSRVRLCCPIKELLNQEVTFDRRRQHPPAADHHVHICGDEATNGDTNDANYFRNLWGGAESRLRWPTSSVATSSDCAQQTDLPNVPPASPHRFPPFA